MTENDKVLLVASPDVAREMLEQDEKIAGAMLICMFAPSDTALVVKYDDWANMVDNGEVFVRKSEKES